MDTINYGIDLGTSNSCIAFAGDGRAEVFRSTENTDYIPSAVMFYRGRTLVGAEAYNNQARREEHVATRFKRAMGTNQQFRSKDHAAPLSAEELSSHVLLELKKMASLRGHNVEQAVICTPANFGASQVDATNEAARLAGIHSPVLLSEPMAASYGYGFTVEKQGAWLVYDLGAGTFDAVVVQVRDGKMTVLDIDGANRLGGSDMDRLLWETVVVPAIAKEAGISRDHKCFDEFRRGGLLKTERAKIRLSTEAVAEIAVDEIENKGGPFSVDGKRIECVVQLTRGALDRVVESLVDKSIEVCQQVLAKHRNVGEILLIGGPTQMPIVRSKVKSLSLPINDRLDPMTAVATGAALYASTQPVSKPKAPVTLTIGEQAHRNVVPIQLDYEPTTSDTEAPLVVRCSDGRVQFAEITAGSGNWTSGRVPLSDGGYVLNVPIQPRRLNAFIVRAFSASGSAMECEPAEFNINHTRVDPEAPPLPQTLWIEVDGDDEGRTEGREVIKKDTPLPAKGTMSVRTTRELVRGGADVVHVKLYEGNSPVLRANKLIRYLPLSGDTVPRKLPANTEIEVTVKVDFSRRITAEAYIPSVDETYELPKVGERTDVRNPHQLEYRRKCLTDEIEQLESENDHADVKVKLELCRRQLWSDDLLKALKAAKAGEQDAGDAYERVDEALREVEERLVLLREKEQEHVLPTEWRRECARTERMLESDWATQQDRQLYDSIHEHGESALGRKRFIALKEATRQMSTLGFAIVQRSPEFWQHMAAKLPDEPECYTNPDEARTALARLRRPRSLGELQADVVRLVQMLPSTPAGGGIAEFASNLRLA